MADYLAGLVQDPPLHLPRIDGCSIDLRALFDAVVCCGGCAAVTSKAMWPDVLAKLGLIAPASVESGCEPTSAVVRAMVQRVHSAYLQLLLVFERMHDADAWQRLTGRPVRGWLGAADRV